MPDKMDIPGTALSLIEWIRSRGWAGQRVVYGLSGSLDSALVEHSAEAFRKLSCCHACYSLRQIWKMPGWLLMLGCRPGCCT